MSKSLRLLLLALATNSLAACSEPERPPADMQYTQAQLGDLRSEIAALNERIDNLKIESVSAQSQIDRLRKLINDNAEIANGNVLRDATRRGDCGYTPAYQRPDGVIVGPGKIECTAETYFKKKN